MSALLAGDDPVLVAGICELDALASETTVAVKVTDMLGEEVLKTHRV